MKCSICGYEYDESIGDSITGIPAGVNFEDLDDSYCCPICGAPKSAFNK